MQTAATHKKARTRRASIKAQAGLFAGPLPVFAQVFEHAFPGIQRPVDSGIGQHFIRVLSQLKEHVGHLVPAKHLAVRVGHAVNPGAIRREPHRIEHHFKNALPPVKRIANGLALARGIGRSQFDPRRYNPNAKGGDIYGLPYRLPSKAIKD